MTSLPPDRPTPSTASIALATGILALLGGYFLGQASSLGLFSTPKSKSKSSTKNSWPNSYDVTVHPDSSDEELMTQLKGVKKREVADSEKEDEESQDSDSDSDSEEGEAELNNFKDNTEDCKLVLVVRTDLGMGKGKIAAQASHATLACYKYFLRHSPSSPLLKRWESLGQAKICVQVPSEEQMLVLQAQAVSLGLCAQVIHDAGRTQIASGSATVLGVGPGPRSVVDGVTGHLKLL